MTVENKNQNYQLDLKAIIMLFGIMISLLGTFSWFTSQNAILNQDVVNLKKDVSLIQKLLDEERLETAKVSRDIKNLCERLKRIERQKQSHLDSTSLLAEKQEQEKRKNASE